MILYLFKYHLFITILFYNYQVVKRSNFEKENDREIRDVPSPSPVPDSTVGKISHSEICPKNNDDNVESKANSKYYD